MLERRRRKRVSWVLVAVLMVVVIGGLLAGWRAHEWQAAKDDASPSPSSAAVRKSTGSTKPSAGPSASPKVAPNGDFTAASEVEIADLGLKFPIPSELAGLTYNY